MKPKFSTGYLTPQSNKRKSLPKPKRVGSNEDLLHFGEISDEVFQKLMNCPIKRKLILNLISSEKQNIEAYKKTFEQNSSIRSPLQKVISKPCESPTALLRRRALEKQRHASENHSDSGSSNGSRPTSRASIASIVPSPVSFDKILDGVIAFVEVRTGDRDRSAGVKATLASMGATVRDKFTKDVTHVIFKDGSFTTYQKANLMKTKLLSVLWLEACKSTGIKVPERDYPAVGTDAYDHNVSALCSQMQKDYEEIIREEFNRSLALGTPLPSAKSLISRRRTIMTPSVSGVNFLSDLSQEDNFEVANIMRRTVHAPAGSTESSNKQFDEISDTGAVIDDDDDIFGHSNENGIKQNDFKENTDHTRSDIEDMDLTDLRDEPLHICTKENNCPNGSGNIYNQKTPKIYPKATSNFNDSGSLNLLDCSTYKRRTELFDKQLTSADANDNQKMLHIFSQNVTPNGTKKNLKQPEVKKQLNPLSNETLMSALHISDKTAEKSTSTNMSSLRVSDSLDKSDKKRISNENASFKSKSSFSPIQSKDVSDILKILEKDISTESNNVTTRKKQMRNKFRTSEDKNVSMEIEKIILTPKTKIKQAEKNITVRKKAERNSYTNIDKSIEQFDLITGSDKKTKNRRLEKKIINFEDSSDEDNEDLRNEKQQKSNMFPKSITKNLPESKNITDCNENANDSNTATDDTKNKRKTMISQKNINISTTINTRRSKRRVDTADNNVSDDKDESPKKITKIITPQDGIKTMKPIKDSNTNEESKLDSSNEIRKTRRNTMNYFTKNNVCGINKKETRKTMSNISKNTKLNNKESTDSNDNGKNRRLRKLYDPQNLIEKHDPRDEQERDDKRQKVKKFIDNGIFIKPSIILFNNTNGNKETDLNLNSTKSPLDSDKKKRNTKKGKSDKKIANSDDDEQVELKNVILNQKKDTAYEQNNDNISTPRRSFKTTRSGTESTTNKNEDTAESKKQKQPQITSPRKSQRVLRTPKTPRNNVTTNVKLTPITPLRNRRSTMEFQSICRSSTKKRLKIDKAKTPTIVCTKMHKDDVLVFNQIVKKLGRFIVEDEVSNKTTHLVAGEPKRTINMLRGVALGCWILNKKWLFSSLEAGKWLPEEDFEETDFSPAVQKNRLQRQAFGPSFTMDIFQDCGSIYISRGSVPRCSDLQELVTLCKGTVTKVARNASIAVGEYIKYTGIVCVKETWILDCISSNKRLSFRKYIIAAGRTSVIV